MLEPVGGVERAVKVEQGRGARRRQEEGGVAQPLRSAVAGAVGDEGVVRQVVQHVVDGVVAPALRRNAGTRLVSAGRGSCKKKINKKELGKNSKKC